KLSHPASGRNHEAVICHASTVRQLHGPVLPVDGFCATIEHEIDTKLVELLGRPQISAFRSPRPKQHILRKRGPLVGWMPLVAYQGDSARDFLGGEFLGAPPARLSGAYDYDRFHSAQTMISPAKAHECCRLLPLSNRSGLVPLRVQIAPRQSARGTMPDAAGTLCSPHPDIRPTAVRICAYKRCSSHTPSLPSDTVQPSSHFH